LFLRAEFCGAFSNFKISIFRTSFLLRFTPI
jgi:hypothetical protein